MSAVGNVVCYLGSETCADMALLAPNIALHRPRLGRPVANAEEALHLRVAVDSGAEVEVADARLGELEDGHEYSPEHSFRREPG